MAVEYDFAEAGDAARQGAYFAHYLAHAPKAPKNFVRIDPDLSAIFPDAQAVNEALRTLARLGGGKPVKRPARRRAS
jgi:hypothetical protein